MVQMQMRGPSLQNEPNGSTAPLIALFERDDAIAVPLLSQVRMAGYDVRAARTPVELFDLLGKHLVALVLVDLGNATAGRREFWVALDAQRRGRALQVMTFRYASPAGMFDADFEPSSARAIADVELHGAYEFQKIIDGLRQRVPLSGITPGVGVGLLPGAAMPPIGAALGLPAPLGSNPMSLPNPASPGAGSPFSPMPNPFSVPSPNSIPPAFGAAFPTQQQGFGAPSPFAPPMPGMPGMNPAANSPFAQPAAANPFSGGADASPFAQPYNVNPFASPAAEPAPQPFGAPANHPFSSPTPFQSPFDANGGNGGFGVPGPRSAPFGAPNPNSVPFGAPNPNSVPFGAPNPNSVPFGASGPRSLPNPVSVPFGVSGFSGSLNGGNGVQGAGAFNGAPHRRDQGGFQGYVAPAPSVQDAWTPPDGDEFDGATGVVPEVEFQAIQRGGRADGYGGYTSQNGQNGQNGLNRNDYERQETMQRRAVPFGARASSDDSEYRGEYRQPRTHHAQQDGRLWDTANSDRSTQLPAIINSPAEQALGTVLVEGALLTANKLEALRGVQQMLASVNMPFKLGELALLFKFLSPDQLLAALLVSRGLVSPEQIAALGRVKQELATSGMDHDLETLLVMFHILPAGQLRDLRAELA